MDANDLGQNPQTGSCEKGKESSVFRFHNKGEFLTT
jgi:hypothetical protein